MSIKSIHTDNAPAAIGPYSQAITDGHTVYVSGQIPINPATGEFAGATIEEQAKQSLTNISNILKAAGTDMSHVVKTTVLLKNIQDFAAMNGHLLYGSLSGTLRLPGGRYSQRGIG